MVTLTKQTLFPGSKIGILGAGQLGKMLTHSAQKMGYQVHVYDTKEACGFGAADQSSLGDFDDEDKVLAFANQVDSLTYEFENINARILEQLESQPNFIQGNTLLKISKNRLREKEWLQSIGSQVVDFKAVNDVKDLESIIQDLGLPLILKTTELGYDGKGQVRINQESDLKTKGQDIESITSQGAIAEAFCPFAFEASVIVSRNPQGQIETFPPSVNIHRAGILCASYTNTQLTNPVLDQIKTVATAIAKESNLVGVCGVEFFITKDNQAIVNEVAPRPHNSGHYTIEGCNLSQFDQHILAITNRDLVQPSLNQPTLSVNILGQHMAILEDLYQAFPQAMVHIYGKEGAKEQRKMGHFTLGLESEQAIKELLTSDFLSKWFDLIG